MLAVDGRLCSRRYVALAALLSTALAMFALLNLGTSDRAKSVDPEQTVATEVPDLLESRDQPTAATSSTVTSILKTGSASNLPYVAQQRVVPFIKAVTEVRPNASWCVLEAMSVPNVPKGEATLLPTCRGPRQGSVTLESLASQSVRQRCRVEFSKQEDCRVEPQWFGNFSGPSDLARFAAFPVVPLHERHWSKISRKQRQLLWEVSPNPFDPRCLTCAASFVHKSMAFTARRWWMLGSWTVHRLEDGKPTSARQLGVRLLGLSEKNLSGTSFAITQDQDPTPMTEWSNVSLASVRGLTFCLTAGSTGESPDINSNAFVALTSEREPGINVVHVFRFAVPTAGARCFWRSMQILFMVSPADGGGPRLALGEDAPSIVARRVTGDCTSSQEALVAAEALRPDQHQGAVAMAPDERLPYLPCFMTQIGTKTKQAQVDGGMDPRYLNFWPFRCDAAYGDADVVTDCVGIPKSRRDEMAAAVARNQTRDGVRVAVLMSGFFRSFANTRQAIMANLLHPHNADVFGITWNVVGRVKKGRPITKKMIVSVAHMKQMVWELLGASGMPGVSEEDLRRKYQYAVWDYRRHQKVHAIVKQNGFLHAGMYHQMQESVAMMARSGRTYDVVVRTRWDLFVAAKFVFRPIHPASLAAPSSSGEGGTARYLLDLGVHCRMEGVWFPRTLMVEDGKLIRHIADTRFKLFGWQACDWVDVAPFRTMLKMANIYDWIRSYNVYSGAQWVEHAYFVDQDIAWQPAHLFICLHRRSNPTRMFC